MAADATGPRLRVRGKFWIEGSDGVALSAWRVALLEQIDVDGSLSEAARTLKIPYRTAWEKLRESERTLGIQLVVGSSGGSTGGGSRLTPAGRAFVARYHALADDLVRLAEERFRELFA